MYLDCEFEQGEEYFILTRTGSSFENFLTYGYINEFETYDLMEIILTDHISLTERDFLSSIDVINKDWEFPFFYLDNKRINFKLRDFFIVKSLTKRKKKLTQEIFKKKLFSIDDVDIYFDAYLCKKKKKLFFLFLVVILQVSLIYFMFKYKNFIILFYLILK